MICFQTSYVPKSKLNIGKSAFSARDVLNAPTIRTQLPIIINSCYATFIKNSKRVYLNTCRLLSKTGLVATEKCPFEIPNLQNHCII